MTSNEVQEISARVQRAQQALIDQINGLSDAAFRRIPAPGEWSIAQNLAHVCESQTMWVSRIEMLCREENPTLGRNPAEQEKRLDAVTNQIPASIGVALQRLKDANERVLSSIAGLSPVQLQRRGQHATYGEVTLQGWLEVLTEHLESHAQQISQAKGG